MAKNIRQSEGKRVNGGGVLAFSKVVSVGPSEEASSGMWPAVLREDHSRWRELRVQRP